MPRRTDPTKFLDTDAMRRFHQTVYGAISWPEGAVLAVPTILKGYGVRTNRVPVDDVEAFVELCVRAVRAGADVCVGVAPQPSSAATLDIGVRGTVRSSLGVPAVFVDIDTTAGACRDAAESPELRLPTRSEAIELVLSLPLPVTALVTAGDELQAWCCFDEPLDWRSPDGAEALWRWEVVVRRAFYCSGFRLGDEALSGPTHMLRVPGTINRKRADLPIPVRLLGDSRMSAVAWESAIAGWIAEQKPAAA